MIFYSPGTYIALFIIANDVLSVMFGGEAREIVEHGVSRWKLLIMMAPDSFMGSAEIIFISAAGIWAGAKLRKKQKV